MRFFKLSLLFLIIFLIFFGLVGCGGIKDKYISVSAVLYLEKKYDKNFTVSENYGKEWPSATAMLKCVDDYGNEFTVKKTGDVFLDNYLSLKFNGQVQREISKAFDSDLKAYASSNCFFSSSQYPKSFSDYLKMSSPIAIVIYTNKELDYDDIVVQLKEYNNETKYSFSVLMFYVDEQAFAQINSFESEPDVKSILDSASFSIDENELVSCSWK